MSLSSTGLYRFNLIFALLIVLDISNRGNSVELNVAIKYVYTLVMLFFILVYFFQFRMVDWTSVSPLIALLFFVVATSVLAINWIAFGNKLSYASAFTASLIFACAAFVPTKTFRLEPDRILHHLLVVFTVASISYMLEVIYHKLGPPIQRAYYGEYGYFDDPHIKDAISILGLCISLLRKRRLAMFLILAAMFVTQVIRPSSSFILAMVICLPLTIALRNRYIVFSRLVVMTTLIVLSLMPFAIFIFFDEIGTAIAAVESLVKSNWLGGNANTAFRLALFREAFQSLEDTSFIVGNGLNGDTTVSVLRDFPGWRGGPIPLHSDLLIILTQAGIIGYFVFVIMIVSMINIRFRLISQPRISEELYALGAASIVSIVCLLIYCSANPFLSYYETVLPFWIIFFVSEIARKAQIVERHSSSAIRPLRIRRNLLLKSAE